MAQRQIDVSLTVCGGVAADQVEYMCAMQLYMNGVPIHPLTQELIHGQMTMDKFGQTRLYSWVGQDRRI